MSPELTGGHTVLIIQATEPTIGAGMVDTDHAIEEDDIKEVILEAHGTGEEEQEEEATGEGEEQDPGDEHDGDVETYILGEQLDINILIVTAKDP